MKKLLALLMLAVVAVGAQAVEIPNQKETLNTLIKVNDYYLKKHPDPYEGIPYYSRKKVYEANIWTRGIYFEGLMALHSIYPANRYYDYAYQWGETHKWGMRRDDTTTRNADNYCCAQTYIDLYNLTPEPKMLTKTKGTMNMLINTPQVNDWTWIDAIQMGMPVLAKMSKLTGDPRYNEKAWEMYSWTRDSLAGGLFNEKEGLWWRDKDFVPPYKEPNGKNCYWSRGNGWVVAALVRVLDEIPADAPHRKDYVRDLEAMCDALVKCQREDGFWNVSLHDGSNFGGKELTGTALFVYGMAWGINNGVLERGKYLPVVVKAWNAMVKDAVHPNGYLGYVQGTGKEPKDGQPVAYDSVPDFDDFGTGCFLLAGTEVYKLK
ncbi:MAG: glycoside hydrolase family 88 protein [Lachnospiraceae bacterium]|uniref:glycoside hydrolase family 88/105 protein n=1 Tax=uncultured Muribaculum sp. TaxID=1918613 RepID=UPI002594D6B5|nr:glycoside hydrolase family 88 protein [uncultured Muribaculum sp.]MCM1092897.1 glycoside hydrolase family 88 protein [Lachnospiraceae bacterium]